MKKNTISVYDLLYRRKILILHVTSAENAGDYKIKVKFNDSTSGVADFRQTVFTDHRSIIRELSDLEKFRDFTVDEFTIVFGNGVDFAPEFIKSLCQ